MDFLRIRTAMGGTSNNSLGNHCKKESLWRSSLPRIKPHMMQQAFRHSCHINSETFRPEICHEVFKGSQPSNSIQLMELFPQQPGLPSSPLPTTSPNTFSEDDEIGRQSPDLHLETKLSKAESASYFQDPCKQPASQLTVFYNGVINVYDVSSDKAEVIMTLAGDNNNESTLQQNSPGFDHSASCITTSTISNGLSLSTELSKPHWSQSRIVAGVNQKNSVQISHAELPIAKKESLRHFLQKRKDRLNKLHPYTTS